jgi:glycine C-acetyltransferase
VHIGDEETCGRVAVGLRDAGFHVDPVVYPAIGMGHARLRFILNAGHTSEQIDGVVDALARLVSD